MTRHLCPSWCVNPIPHPTDVDNGRAGYFHDGELQGISIAGSGRPSGEAGERHLMVKPSRFVLNGNRAEPAVVELSDEYTLLAQLAPDEARQLAGMLTAAAHAIEGGTNDARRDAVNRADLDEAVEDLIEARHQLTLASGSETGYDAAYRARDAARRRYDVVATDLLGSIEGVRR